MNDVTALIFFSKGALDSLQEIITVACESPGASLLRLTSYQHFLWALDANKGISPNFEKSSPL